MGTFDVNVAVLGLLAVLLFLPLSAFTYHRFRRPWTETRRRRIIQLVGLPDDYAGPYLAEPGKAAVYLTLAVAFTTIVATIGLSALLFEWKVPPNHFFKQGHQLVLGMAVLGAYLWGIQNIFWRCMLNDLVPGVYYGVCIRMMLSAGIAVVVFGAYDSFATDGLKLAGDFGAAGALAFLIGMFPQRGISWLRDRFAMFGNQQDGSVRQAPLSMIEGIDVHDRLRLEQCGIDNCYDLAGADFIPLILDSPYSARILEDWILQAKLCMYCSDSMQVLRPLGIRTIEDLSELAPEQLDALAKETPVARTALEQAKRHLEKHAGEIDRLHRIVRKIGTFAADDLLDASSRPPSPGPERRDEPHTTVEQLAGAGEQIDQEQDTPGPQAGRVVEDRARTASLGGRG